MNPGMMVMAGRKKKIILRKRNTGYLVYQGIIVNSFMFDIWLCVESDREIDIEYDAQFLA